MPAPSNIAGAMWVHPVYVYWCLIDKYEKEQPARLWIYTWIFSHVLANNADLLFDYEIAAIFLWWSVLPEPALFQMIKGQA